MPTKPKTTTLADLVAEAQGVRDPFKVPKTKAEIAELCGVTRQYLYKLLAGESYPSEWTISKLAHGLGVSVETVTAAIDATLES